MGTSVRPDSTLFGIAELLKGLAAIRDPKRNVRKELLDQALGDPQLAQQLALQLQENPDAFKSLGGPRFLKGTNDADLEGFLRGVKIDPSTQFARNEAKDMLNLQGAAKASPVVQQMASMAGVQSQPVLTPEQQRQYDEYKSRVLGIPSQASAKHQKAQTRSLNLAADEAEKVKQDELAADALIASKGIDPKKGLYRYVSPNVPGAVQPEQMFKPQEVALLRNVPKYMKSLEQEQQDIWHAETNQRQRDLHQASLDARVQAKEESLVKFLVERVMLRTGTLIDPVTAKQALDNPELLIEITKKKETDITPEERPLYELARALGEVRKQAIQTQLKPAITSFINSPVYKRAFTPGRGQSRANKELVDELNSTAVEMFKNVDLKPPQYRYDDGGPLGRAKIIRVDGETAYDESLGAPEDTTPKGLIKDETQLTRAAQAASGFNDSQILQSLRQQYPNATEAQLSATLQDIKKRTK